MSYKIKYETGVFSVDHLLYTPTFAYLLVYRAAETLPACFCMLSSAFLLGYGFVAPSAKNLNNVVQLLTNRHWEYVLIPRTGEKEIAKNRFICYLSNGPVLVAYCGSLNEAVQPCLEPIAISASISCEGKTLYEGKFVVHAVSLSPLNPNEYGS